MVPASSGTYFGIAMTAHNIYTIAGNGTPTYAGNGGAATAASLFMPAGLVVDPAGNLIIADLNNRRIRMVPVQNGTNYGVAMTANNIYTIAGTGTGGYAGDGAAATSAQIYNVSSLAIDPAGNLFLADWTNKRVRMIDPQGTIRTIAGTGALETTALGAGFQTQVQPRFVALDSLGTLFLAGDGNNRVLALQ